jgi:hypothetical protein
MRIFNGAAALVGVAAVAFVPLASAGITVDGNLADWGVNLQTQNVYYNGSSYEYGDYQYSVNGVTGYYNQLVLSSFAPVGVTGISYVAQLDNAPEDHGGGFCNVDAIYATFSPSTAYFAVVAATNPNGTEWDGYGSMRFGPGDLNVTVAQGAQTTNFGIGARPISLSKYGLVSSIWGPGDLRNPATWATYTNVNGNGTYYTTTQALVVKKPNWSWVDDPDMPVNAYFVGNSGTVVGDATAAWKRLVVDGNAYVGYDQPDPYGHEAFLPYSTWVYEVAVPLDDLGITPGSRANLSLSFAADCGNDSMSLANISVDAPEPISVVFFGTGIVCLFGFAVRQRILSKKIKHAS